MKLHDWRDRAFLLSAFLLLISACSLQGVVVVCWHAPQRISIPWWVALLYVTKIAAFCGAITSFAGKGWPRAFVFVVAVSEMWAIESYTYIA